MTKKVIQLNLKEINIKYYLPIILSGIIITLIKTKVANLPIYNYSSMINIELLAFGGIDQNYDITKNIIEFIEWLFPIITVIFVVSITNEEMKSRAMLILPRIKHKYKWSICTSISILIMVLKYYLVLVVSSLITILIINNSNIVYDINRYWILIYIFSLNSLTISAIIIFSNNISMLVGGSKKIEVIACFFCIIPVLFLNSSTLIGRTLIINQGIVIRHFPFVEEVLHFSLNYSLIYLIICIVINVVIGTIILRNTDINNI
ncbi:hypothetical protein [Clostridium manihotivorum]|uniref:Uncharacterized protein n=1 Tax=Clostridium manihotivorum TaxID=2320868 RepID=A0A410DPM3_9CLOT|nr:hypothetical protein [Clostridium manihotivorum]QAA31022.1 hypothetical protein C1I91_04740 [Clostridium manihotivorum]